MGVIHLYDYDVTTQELCKGLVWSEQDQRHYCQLVLDAGIESRLAQDMVIGTGCSSSLNSWYCEPNQDKTKQ